MVGEQRLEAFPPLSDLAPWNPEPGEMIGGTGCIPGSNLLETIERCADVRLLVAEPAEQLGAPSTQDLRPTLLELIEEVPGMVIA